MKNFLNNLTIKEILDAFPDEIPEIVPREISRLEELLKPLKDQISSYHTMNYEPAAVIIYSSCAISLSGQEENIKHLKQLKTILSMHKRRLLPIQPNSITDEKIALAKQSPIKDMYSFEKMKLINKRIKASCPFHTDTSPSFYIYETNTFHCFSCGLGGSAIDFYMKINNIDFKSAVNALSQ